MCSVLTNLEFFTFENEIWVRKADGSMKVLRESDYELIS